MDLVSLLIVVIVFGLVAWLILSVIPMPGPFKTIALVILVIIMIAYLLDGHNLGHLRFIK